MAAIHIFMNFLLLDNLVFLMIELERRKMVDGSIGVGVILLPPSKPALSSDCNFSHIS
jgi:hypothetical protein